MRGLMYGILAVVIVRVVAQAAPLSGAELKNLLTAIRQNRTTQRDFRDFPGYVFYSPNTPTAFSRRCTLVSSSSTFRCSLRNSLSNIAFTSSYRTLNGLPFLSVTTNSG